MKKEQPEHVEQLVGADASVEEATRVINSAYDAEGLSLALAHVAGVEDPELYGTGRMKVGYLAETIARLVIESDGGGGDGQGLTRKEAETLANCATWLDEWKKCHTAERVREIYKRRGYDI